MKDHWGAFYTFTAMHKPNTDSFYMQRCLQLARLGAGYVAPNPMVGAVLVHGEQVIGEGWHRQYGQAHAEVNCLHSVSEENRSLVPDSTLYVSLEPCAHFGKTPPCADLIIREGISRVVVGCTDPFARVNGLGIQKLRDAGIEVLAGVEEELCRDLNKRFFRFHRQQRPYIILKWAQSADGFIGGLQGSRVYISNALTNRLVHRWRSEESAILVGTQTALLDNPRLDNRLYPGPGPVRMVIDKELKLPGHLHLLDGSIPTIVFNHLREELSGTLMYRLTDPHQPLIPQILDAMYQMNYQSLLVEGGRVLLQSFIDAGLWDEARVIVGADDLGAGTPAPRLSQAGLTAKEQLLGDSLYFYAHSN